MKQIAPNSMIQNRYLVVQMIGKGGMGEVYLAVDQRLGSAVALKRTFFNENAELGSAFEREAKILGRLRHSVLPKVIDHFIEGGEQYLVMEHISGDDLGKRLENAGEPFPLRWVMFWADQMLDALNYLHSHEPPIIHRDIKPENLKLTDDNHIVLLDFGLSKDFDSESKKASLGTGSVVGYSPYYASMEQVRGTGTDARSDIYSLSATLYQLLANYVPVDALTRADAMLGGLPDPIIPLTQANPGVSQAVSDVILKGIAVRKEDRFANAGEMQKALRRAFNKGADAESASPREAQTAIMEVPPEISGVSAPVNDDLPISGDTIQFDAAKTDPVIMQADIKTQIFAGDFPEEREQETLEHVGEVTEPAHPVTLAAAAGVASSSPTPIQTHEQARPLVPQTKKSKGGMILGGLIGLLVLAGIAGGGGWYAYSKYYLPSQTAASATPTPETKVSPTPQSTTEVVTGADQNGNSNSMVSQKDDSNTSNTTTKVTGTPTDIRQIPPPTTVGKNPQSTTTTTKPPITKTVTKPKVKDDRTVILQ